MLSIIFGTPSFLAAQNLDTAKIDEALGRSGRGASSGVFGKLPCSDSRGVVEEQCRVHFDGPGKWGDRAGR